MNLLKLIPILFIFLGDFPYENLAYAGSENPNNYRVLSTSNKKLSIANVEYYLEKGDEFIKKGNLDKAKDSFLDARKLTKQLASFIQI